MTQKLTKEDAKKVLKVIDHGLVKGLGDPKLGEMCVVEMTSDDILSLSADIATEACIKFKTQGSKWLDICD